MRIALALLCVLLLALAPAPDGERLFRTGDPAGSALVLGVRTQPAPACANCHGRSAQGSSEGGTFAPQVTPATLRTPRTGHKPRPAYDAPSLARAIRDGIDAAGRPLAGAMPRYRLDDAALAALVAYLLTPAARPPGVTGESLRFATIVTADAPPERRETLLGVLRAFFAERNRDVRGERARRGHDPQTLEPLPYRHWSLSVWELHGPRARWREQLERHYAAQPVFAVLSGISGGDWQPVHAFCEDQRLPCLFPQTPWPATAAPGGYYTAYFSRGAVLEAEVIAAYLRARHADAHVLQVYHSGSRLAAEAFRAGWPGPLVQAELVAEERAARYWRALIARARPDVLVLWLPASALPDARWLTGDDGPTKIFVSEMLAGDAGIAALAPLQPRLYVAHPYSKATRYEAWLTLRRLSGDVHVATKALFVCAAAADALKHLGEEISREALLERIEHMNDSPTVSSVFARPSLGPGQRFLVKGARIARPVSDGGRVAESGWIIP